LRIKTTNLHEQLDLTHWPTNVELRKIIRDEQWYLNARRSRISQELNRLNARIDEFAESKIKIMRQMQKLQSYYASLMARKTSPSDLKRLKVIQDEARMLRNTLESDYEAFKKGPYKLYGSALKAEDTDDSKLKAWAMSLTERLNKRVEEGTFEVIKRMDGFIKECNILITKGTNHGKNE
jgi:DNA repair exonuclease SbcCD ATPase subunit